MKAKKISKNEKIKNKLKELANDSTIHGVRNGYKSKRKVFKFFWFCFFVTSIVLGIKYVTENVIEYFEYQVVTKIDSVKEMPTEFPAVTFYYLKNSLANSKDKTKLKDLLLFCLFNSEICTENDFITNEDKFGLISYTFKRKQSFLPGAFYGLQVALVNKIDTNTNGILEGLRIAIHNSSTNSRVYPIYSNEGFNIAPGFFNEIVVKRVFSYKLGQPFNNCIKDVKSINSFNSDLFKYILTSTNFSYQQKDCFDFCIGRELLRHFNHSNEIDTKINAYTRLLNNNFTDVYKSEIFRIYIKISKEKLYDLCEPICPLECDSIEYEATTSFTKFLPDGLKSYFKDALNIHLNELLADHEIENLIHFNIFYNDLKYTSITQMPKLNSFEFISIIGGTLSLFIGFSFLNLAEFIEILIEIIFIILKRKRKMKKEFNI